VIAELIGTEAAFGVTAGDVVYDDLTLYPRRNRLFARIGNPIALQCGGTPKTYYITSRDKASYSRTPREAALVTTSATQTI
jgi:hypothetical protein